MNKTDEYFRGKLREKCASNGVFGMGKRCENDTINEG